MLTDYTPYRPLDVDRVLADPGAPVWHLGEIVRYGR